MDIILDLFQQIDINANNPLSVAWFLFINGGFIFVVWAMFFGLKDVWLNWRNDKFAADIKWIYLAIDVPKINEQSTKAVEQIFNSLMGAMSGSNLLEKWWKGKYQTNFSLEIVSIEGYIQYIIRTPKIFRDLVESTIYAQYPDTQITEIEDYTNDIDTVNFKQQGYDFWGAQFGLVNDYVYPIKTYPLFEHVMTQTTVDPLASLLEIFSRIGKGEQAWLQIVIKPVKDDWTEKSDLEVKKLTGADVPGPDLGLFDKALDMPNRLVTKAADAVFSPTGGAVDSKDDKSDKTFKVLNMTPGERWAIEAVQHKAEKPGFMSKMRYLYITKDKKLDKPKGVSGFMGVLKQFALLNSNSFKPISSTKTSVDGYLRVDARTHNVQKKLLKNYKSRSGSGADGEGFILNTEELATLYHFPYTAMTSESLQTVEVKRVGAPARLPVEDAEEIQRSQNKSQSIKSISRSANKVEKEEAIPPTNLPM